MVEEKGLRDRRRLARERAIMSSKAAPSETESNLDTTLPHAYPAEGAITSMDDTLGAIEDVHRKENDG